jgi:hypothetical protein
MCQEFHYELIIEKILNHNPRGGGGSARGDFGTESVPSKRRKEGFFFNFMRNLLRTLKNNSGGNPDPDHNG